jgi:hypothetical protein
VMTTETPPPPSSFLPYLPTPPLLLDATT